MEFVEKRMNSDYMTQTEQMKSAPMNAFVNEELNSANFDGVITKP